MCDDTLPPAPQQRPAVERHRLAGGSRQIRRRDPRTGLAGPPAEHHPRRGHGASGEAGVAADRIDAIAFTRGPGLVGSLLVGVSFTKGLSIARNIPMVEVNHLQGHILSHFIDLRDRTLPHPDPSVPVRFW